MVIGLQLQGLFRRLKGLFVEPEQYGVPKPLHWVYIALQLKSWRTATTTVSSLIKRMRKSSNVWTSWTSFPRAGLSSNRGWKKGRSWHDGHLPTKLPLTDFNLTPQKLYMYIVFPRTDEWRFLIHVTHIGVHPVWPASVICFTPGSSFLISNAITSASLTDYARL